MLSICIPIYNFDITKLVKELNNQSKLLNIKYEIVLIDDSSKHNFQEINKLLNKNESVKYIQLNQNIGRSKIRNLFLKHTKYDNLLFLDCDIKVLSNNFINNYTNELNNKSEIICGGISYDTTKPKKNKHLRWKTRINKECSSTHIRETKPYASFISANFVINKSILQNIRFNEELVGYGHEDTLFGYELKKLNINICHIHNPIIHLQTDTNLEFLLKTKNAIKNLVFIKNKTNNLDFDNSIKMLKFYKKYNKYLIKHVFYALLKLIYPFIYIILLKSGRNQILYDIYKFTILIQENNKWR